MTLPDLSEATLDELSSGLRNNDFTSVDLVKVRSDVVCCYKNIDDYKAYIERIQEVNDKVKAVTEVNPDALEIAARLDAERARGNASGLLHGIPILLKNNLATQDRLNTTAGSYALLGATVPRDSTVAAKVRGAGGIILGKANLSQWASWRGNASNGWSAYGGQCQGVYYPEQDPSGSSSGSAVASAIGLAFAALGTETTGSLILPGQASNVVAIKPTVGLTSRALLIPVSQRQDTVGPLARTVKDAATILQAIAGRDPDDNYTSAQPAQVPDYIKACNINSLSGARIGIPQNLISSASYANTTAFYAAVEILKAAGATVVDNLNITQDAIAAVTLPDPNAVAVLNADISVDLPDWYLSKLTSNPNNIKSLSDLRNFTQQFPLEDYKSSPFVTTMRWDQSLALGFNNTSPEFWPYYQTNLDHGGRQSILGLLANYSLDALIAPTSSSYQLPAMIGAPVINVPLGFDNNDQTISGSPSSSVNNNPVGISFMGAKWSEEKLIGYAYAFEQKTKVRENGPKPYLLPKTQLADVIDGSRNSSQNATSVARSNIALGGVKR